MKDLILNKAAELFNIGRKFISVKFDQSESGYTYINLQVNFMEHVNYKDKDFLYISFAKQEDGNIIKRIVLPSSDLSEFAEQTTNRFNAMGNIIANTSELFDFLEQTLK